jgi:hypothetical protein
LNTTGAFVILSTGAAFGAEEKWFADGSVGETANFIADVDGDGRADLIRVDETSIKVALSTGHSFGPMTEWYGGRFPNLVLWTVAPEPASPRINR